MVSTAGEKWLFIRTHIYISMRVGMMAKKQSTVGLRYQSGNEEGNRDSGTVEYFWQ